MLFVGFFYVIRRWTASASSYALVLFPVVTLAVGAVRANEPVTPSFVVGTLLVIAGVCVGLVWPAPTLPIIAPAT